METQSHLVVRMFFAVILVCSINCFIASASSNESDVLALLAIKDKITGDPFGALSSWNDSLHYCEWHGVTCGRRHRLRVTALDLFSKKLEGTLSPHIGNLSFIRDIILNMNNFHGPIPQEIDRLSRLQTLSFDNNSFSGEVPGNLSYCSNLRQLSLIDNHLSGKIPLQLTTLPKLRVLALAENNIQGTIPPSLGNLSSLAKLDLGECNLEGSIPYELCRTHNFENIIFQGNNLMGEVPVCLYNLSLLAAFGVASNQLHGDLPLDIGFTLPRLQYISLGVNLFTGSIPVSLSNASNLEVITLEQNRFTGPIPNDLGRLPRLQILSLHTNHLGTTSGDDLNFINSLANCTNLEYLVIEKNTLKGIIPNSIANLSTQLAYLQLSHNQIYGRLPSGFENLINLSIMDFGFNHLTGNIPRVLMMPPNIRQLYLNGNQFSGKISDFFNCSTLLTHLVLSANKLQGRIPPSLENCQNLFLLELSHNNLNGTIPKEVIGLSTLKLGLDLSNNDLSGSLPLEVGNLSDLVLLDVSRNKLSYQIPNTIGNCLTLEKLKMDGNFFQGQIPESLSKLKGINHLDLSQNKLSGPIPEYLGNFTLLTYLNLSFNDLEGSVPKGGIFENATAVSVVGNSNLCGGVVGLKLRPCPYHTTKQINHFAPKIILSLVVVSACLLVFLFFIYHQRRLSKAKLSSPSLSSHQHTRVSYAELLKATNNFSTDNLIGVGAYASVYKGILTQLNKTVAVKVLNLERQGASKTFLSECNALRHVRHRNLLKIITSCSSVDFQGNDFKALVFEFMPNGSLEEWLHPHMSEQDGKRNLNFLQRLNVAIDVASALDHLHHHCQPTLVHCDLKPSNVLFDDGMVAHVADFGLAKILANSSQGQASSVAIKGSIGYVAPEYGMGGEVSMQGDVYSYGILLLEMFTGKRPTDDMFQDGRNLHSFCEDAAARQVVNIVDPRMLLGINDEATNTVKTNSAQVRMQECLLPAIQLGVACSVGSPVERMNMGQVIRELYHIRDHHQRVGNWITAKEDGI